MKVFSVICIILLLNSALIIAKPIRLPSDDFANIDIIEKASDLYFTLTLTFPKIVVFDEITNENMNILLAQFYAEEAISEYYKQSKSINFAKVNIKQNNVNDKTYGIIYDIPFSAINNISIKGQKQNIKKAMYSLNTEELLDDFRSSCFRDLKIAEAFFYDKIKENTDKNKLITEIQIAFQALIKRIENDNYLFMSEKDELLEKTKKVKCFLLKQLQNNQPENSQTITINGEMISNISNANFSPRFKEFIIHDNILLEHGGCRVFELESGQLVLLAVGIAYVNNNSPQDRLLRRKIAETKAFGELAKHQAVEITFFNEYLKKTEIKREKDTISGKLKKKNIEKTTIQAEAYFDKLETVGTWYSKEGDLFFLAKGCFIE